MKLADLIIEIDFSDEVENTNEWIFLTTSYDHIRKKYLPYYVSPVHSISSKTYPDAGYQPGIRGLKQAIRSIIGDEDDQSLPSGVFYDYKIFSDQMGAVWSGEVWNKKITVDIIINSGLISTKGINSSLISPKGTFQWGEDWKDFYFTTILPKIQKAIEDGLNEA